MNIVKPNWHWRLDPAVSPLKLEEVDSIALHHMAHPTADIWEIEKWHLDRDNRTWKGFGYNYWIGFDGSIYEGRGLNQGAGVLDNNSHIISIGFQGAYEPSTKYKCNSIMPEAQYLSGVELIRYLRRLITTIKTIDGHKHWQNTSCPGKYFPLAVMITEALMEDTAVYKHIILGNGKIPQTIEFGACGDHVKLLQRELNFASFACGAIDGDFGIKTLAAVKKFQKTAGLTKDGIVGPRTWDALLGVDIVELDPLQLSAKLVNSSGKILSKTVKSFINGNFFNYGNPGVTIGWLMSAGKVLHDRHEYKTWKGNIKGTLLVLKDGTVKAAQMPDKDIASIVDQIKFACQGFYLPASGDVKESIKFEGFNPDSVGYRCNRLAIGFNGKKINIVVQRFSDAARMRHTMDLLGCAGRSICLDSGGSVNLVAEGKAVFTTSRVLANILTW